jgi:CRISPR/Cas system-associated exonuclease Cas4 (RecB family)
MLEAFLASEIPTHTGEIIAVEEMLRTKLADGLPEIVSRVDAVWSEERGLAVVDFKSSRGRWNEQKAIEAADQLLLYRHATRSIAAELQLPVSLRFIVITKAKQPVVQTFDVPASGDRVRQLADSIRPVWSAMQAGNFYPSPSPMNCSTCPFKHICPAFAGR